LNDLFVSDPATEEPKNKFYIKSVGGETMAGKELVVQQIRQSSRQLTAL
jgi:hypothetical protein